VSKNKKKVILHEIILKKNYLRYEGFILLFSYGWGGVGGKKIASVLLNAKFKIIDVIEFRGIPKKLGRSPEISESFINMGKYCELT